MRSKSLNCSFLNIDRVKNRKEIVIKDVDEQCYDTYKYDFLTTQETENRLTKNIILDYWRNQ